MEFHPPVCYDQSVAHAIPVVRCCFAAKEHASNGVQQKDSNVVTTLVWLTKQCRHRLTDKSAKPEAVTVKTPGKGLLEPQR